MTVTARQRGYIVVDPWNHLYYYTLNYLRKEAVQTLLDNQTEATPWRKFYRKGWRCVRVELSAKVRR